MFNQRKSELEARRKLIEHGNMPKLEAINLEAQFKIGGSRCWRRPSAERDRGVLRAPWDGIVYDTAEVGGAALSFTGAPVAQMVALDPLLAVVEVSETRLAGLKVGDPAEVRLVNGQKVMGRLRYVAKTASATTRTYRVEVEIPNPNNAIPDGITAEVVDPDGAGAGVRACRARRSPSRRAAISACAWSKATQGRLRSGRADRGRPESHVGRRNSGRRAR